MPAGRDTVRVTGCKGRARDCTAGRGPAQGPTRRQRRKQPILRRTALLLAISLVWTQALADLSDGLRAFNAGDYATAYLEWRITAAEGDPIAQYALGRLYEIGLGVPQSLVHAHAWYALAAVQGYAEAQRARDSLAARMTEEQLTKARVLADRLIAAPQ